jgi:branched-chain amino acid transport system substrate-binding protein
MKKLFLITLIIAVIAVLVLAGCAKSAGTTSAGGGKVLNIGAVWGLTGTDADIHGVMAKGETLCESWLNSQGGITVNGQKYKINVITLDTKSTVEGAIMAAQQLVFQNKVKFVTGQPTPAEVEGVRSITDPNKVMYMAATDDTPSSKFPYTFTSLYPYKWPKTPLYDYLVKTYPNVKTVAVMNQDEAGNVASGAEAIVQIQKHNLTLGDHEVYPFAATDYLPIVTKVVSTNPDAIDMCLNMPSHAAVIVKDARQLGYTGPIFGGSPWDPNLELSIVTAQYATDFFWPTFDPSAPENQSLIPPQMAQVIQIWNQTYQGVPFVLDSLQGWDSLWCLTQAIEKAQSLDPTAVAKAFENMGTIETGYGTAPIGGLQTYGINAVVCESIPITRLENGKTEFEGFSKLQIP